MDCTSQTKKDKTKFQYAYWRTDKPKEEGFSHELISCETKKILDKTDLDSLHAHQVEGVDTIYKSIQMNLKKWPNMPWMGTRVGNKYEWLTYSEAMKLAENLSYGIMALELAPSIEGDTGPEDLWKFIGI